MSHEKTIIIVDDHPLMTSGLSNIIVQYTDYKVIECLHNGKDLLQKLKFVQPDLLMLDINMPKLDGIEAAKMIRIQYPSLKIVIVSMYSDERIFNALIEIGVHGFIPKQTDTKVFVEALTDVMNGGNAFISPFATGKVAELDEAATAGKLQLSEREIEIIRLIKTGRSTKEISEMLHLSPFTVNTHRKNICKKLKISSPLALIKYIHQMDV